MQAVEFQSTIDKGTIKVPEQFMNQVGQKVRVILLTEEVNKSVADKLESEKTAKGFGMLAHRANKNLWADEETAMARAVIDKYANH